MEQVRGLGLPPRGPLPCWEPPALQELLGTNPGAGDKAAGSGSFQSLPPRAAFQLTRRML